METTSSSSVLTRDDQIDTNTRTDNLFEFIPEETSDPNKDHDLKGIRLHKTQTDVAVNHWINSIRIGIGCQRQESIFQIGILIDGLDILGIDWLIVFR